MGDMNYWGLVVVPIGVAICFGPALIAWVKAEWFTDTQSEKKDRH